MSGHPHTVHIPPPERLGAGRFPVMLGLAGISVVGLLLCILGIVVDHTQFAYSWFFAFYYFFTIALGAFFYVTLHYACDSDWTVLAAPRVGKHAPALPRLRRPLHPVPLARPARCPLEMDEPRRVRQPRARHPRPLAQLPLLLSPLRRLLPLLHSRGFYFRRLSVRQDDDGNPVHTRRMHDHSYLALVIFGLLQTFLGNDWLSNLRWEWASSLFGVYNFAIIAQAGLAGGIVVIALFRKAGYLLTMNQEHFYLMGKLLFGFTIFWGYVAFGQYMLIWYANIPDETIFYNDHNRGNWIYLTYFLAAGKYVFPTCYLLAQDNKKSLRALTFIAGWILFMHGVELYWFIMPFAHMNSILPSWMDFVAWITVGSILAFFYIFIAARRSLFPTRDPRLVECLTITN